MVQKPKLSKRYTLSKLAPQWREKIFSSIKSERLKLAVAVLTCSGCRPSELEHGVLVRVKDGGLLIGIQGSKVDAEMKRGQPLRSLKIDSSTVWGAYLMEHVVNIENQAVLVKYDAGGISERLREKSREIWPRRATLISAYTYRHYVGKSLKESGASVEKIASVLGHATDFSQTAYGRAGSGKKGAGQHGIISATASNPIRHSTKTDRLNRFIKSANVISDSSA